MQIGAKYSHLNGLEYLQVHLPHIWQDVEEVIAGIDAERCRTKKSKEKTKKGRMLFAPEDLNAAFKNGFDPRGWTELRQKFWTTEDPKLLRQIYGRPAADQKQAISDAGHAPLMSYNQTDFVKERVAVEV